MQTADIDLKKNPEIADWAADREPGDRGCLYFSIKAKNDQTMTITFDEVGEDKDDEESEKEEAGNQGSGDVVTPPGEGVDAMGRELADSENAGQ